MASEELPSCVYKLFSKYDILHDFTKKSPCKDKFNTFGSICKNKKCVLSTKYFEKSDALSSVIIHEEIKKEYGLSSSISI